MYLVGPPLAAMALQLRQDDNSQECSAPCGAAGQYCCSSGSTCYTSNGIAGCSVATPSSTLPNGQIACGPIICNKRQYCAYSGQCLDLGHTWNVNPTTDITSTPGASPPPATTPGSSTPPASTPGGSARLSDTAASETATSPIASGSPTAPESSKSSAWIAGPAAGGVVGVILIVLVVWFIYKKRSQGVVAASTAEPERFEKAELEASDLARRATYELPSDEKPFHELPANDKPFYELPSNEVRSELP